MSVMSRKQREIAERHNHFLAIARQILHEEGFHQLTMDRVADLAEYSKGTVYQHFNCKEEILGQLCISAMQHMQALSQRALKHQGPHRERLLALFIAHDIWQRTEEDDVEMMQNYHTDQVLEKLTPATRTRHDELEQGLFNSVKSIVEDAMEAGDLPRGALSAADVVFGLWSLIHGAATLRSYNMPIKELGVGDPGTAIVELLKCLLDGMNWQPMSDNENMHEQIQILQRDLFLNEILAFENNRPQHC